MNKQAAAGITQTLFDRTGVDPQWLYVLFEDVPASDWGAGARLFGRLSAE
ncbi:tautomerase family protein [Pseudomonas putida]|nr:tautomerase family protein [Pseudomonas putida]